MDNTLFGDITLEQATEIYKNCWLVIKPLRREGHIISHIWVLKSFGNKDEALSEARRRKKKNEDVAIICTYDSDELTPRESAFVFQMYCGMEVSKEYLD